MIKIESVNIQGFHNVADKTYHFGDLTYLHGPNGAGKSTVLQAIQLALLGYIPGTNKQSAAIFRHANKSVMSVTLKLNDNGQEVTIQRTWAPSGNAISNIVSITPEDYPLKGLLYQLELPIFNFNEFVNMSPNQLKEWFVNFLPKADYSINWLQELEKSVKSAGVLLTDHELIDEILNVIKSFNLSGIDEVRKLNEYLKSTVTFKKKELSRLQDTIQSLIYYDTDEDYTEDEVREQLDVAYRKRADAQAYKEVSARAEAAAEKLKQYSHLKSTIDEDTNYIVLVNERKELTDKLDTIATALKECDKDRYKHRLDIANRQSVVDSDGVCPFTKAVCESVVGLKDKYAEEIAKSRLALQNSETQISKLQEEQTAVQTKLAQCETAMKNIVQEYASRDIAAAGVIQVPHLSEDDIDLDKWEGEVSKWEQIKVKIEANKRYNEMVSKLTQDKYRAERELAAYNAWIQLTGVNGLQNDTQATQPFIDLAESITQRLAAVFNEPVTAYFNLENKVNSFRFGLKRGDKEIPFDLLSSGEKCLYTLALMMCLITQSDSPLRVLLIDDLLDHLDPDNIQATFESLQNVKDIQMIFAGVQLIHNPKLTVDVNNIIQEVK